MRIISVIQMAEQAATEEKMVSHGQAIGELGAKGDATSCFYSPQDQENGAFSFATDRVINRWTTFPLPTVQQWQEASRTDPDVAYIINRIKTRRRVVLQTLVCRRYYLFWARGQFEVENDILYQLEHPKGVRI